VILASTENVLNGGISLILGGATGMVPFFAPNSWICVFLSRKLKEWKERNIL
jgi:hypothetical protein